jgi:hypothetical protein
MPEARAAPLRAEVTGSAGPSASQELLANWICYPLVDLWKLLTSRTKRFDRGIQGTTRLPTKAQTWLSIVGFTKVPWAAAGMGIIPLHIAE